MKKRQASGRDIFKSIAPHITDYELLLWSSEPKRTTFRIETNRSKMLDELVTGRTFVDVFEEMENILEDDSLRNTIFSDRDILSIRDIKIEGAQRSFQINNSSYNTLSNYSKLLRLSKSQIVGALIDYLYGLIDNKEKAREELVPKLEKIKDQMDHILKDSLTTLTRGDKMVRSLINACQEVDNTIMQIAYSLDTGEDIEE